MKPITAILCCLIVACLPATAQDLSGHVMSRDSKKAPLTPMAGATVRWLGSNVGSITKKDGTFIIRRTNEKTLVVSFVGYKSDTSTVAASSSSVEIILTPELKMQEISVEAATQTITDANVKTEKISKHQLEKSACCSLAESFEKSPSVEVSFSDAATGAKQIQLLGLRGVYTLTMTDVIPMIRGLATPFGLDYVPGSFIENISISKGAGSVLNGYEGITGQINIEYKRPLTEGPLFVNAYGNSNGRMELNATSAQHLSDTWSSLIMLHGGLMQNQLDQNHDGFSDMPHYKNFNGVVRLFHEGEDGTEFQVMTKMILDDIMSGTVDGSVQEHTDHAFDVGTKATRFEFYSKYAINPLFESPETRMGIQLAGTHHKTQTVIGSREYNGTENMLYSKLIFTTTASETINLAYGLSFMLNDLDETFDAIRPRDSIETYKRREIVPGAFAEATYSPSDKLSLVAGLRADAHNLYGTFVTPRLHLKYSPTEDVSMRLSAGNGTRVANALSDNISSLVNQRNVSIAQDLRPERAWNYGASVTATLDVFNTPLTFDAELFRTQFSNQVVVDIDRSPTSLFISNLNGTSYSNSGLVQLQMTPIERLDLSLSYRLIDAKTTTGGILQERALISPHRVLFTAGYSTPKQVWQFDFTAMWNSGGRVPLTAGNPDSFRMADKFDAYYRLNTQVTRRFSGFDVYAGVENINNFIQKTAVLSPLDPHSNYFDASLIWGPLESRFVYIGFRWKIDE